MRADGPRSMLAYRVVDDGDALTAMVRFCVDRAEGSSADVEGAVAEIFATIDEVKIARASRGCAQSAAAILAWCATRSVSVAAVARQLDIHPVSLARSFRREFGCTMSRYVARTRTSEAARLLTASPMTITEIALECGFVRGCCRRIRSARHRSAILATDPRI